MPREQHDTHRRNRPSQQDPALSDHEMQFANVSSSMSTTTRARGKRRGDESVSELPLSQSQPKDLPSAAARKGRNASGLLSHKPDSSSGWIPKITITFIISVLASFALGVYMSGLVYFLVGGITKVDAPGNQSAAIVSNESIMSVTNEWKFKYEELLAQQQAEKRTQESNEALEQEKAHVEQKAPVEHADELKVPVGEGNAQSEASNIPATNSTQKESAEPVKAPQGGAKAQEKQMQDMMKQSQQSANKGAGKDELEHEAPTPIFYSPVLPASSVWCKGETLATRVCKFRNLYYTPKEDRFFIVRTNSSVLEGLPNPSTQLDPAILEVGSVHDHPWTSWTFDEVAATSPLVRNAPLRYETELNFLFKRFHPLNIMHNLHDDVIVLYHHLKQYVGGGEHSIRMPFSIFDYRIQFVDPYGFTDSTRPFQYLSFKSLRMKDYLEADPNVITGFRDAVVGASKLTTWYQYGFTEPQGPIKNKFVNGLHIREVAEWFCRRLQIPLGEDEDYFIQTSKPDVNLDELRQASVHYEDMYKTKALDLPGTDLIIILSRGKNRLIINENEMKERLAELYGYEVVIVRNEDHTFEEQIKLMRRAKIVLAMHGSILIMTMWCRRGTVIIELYPFAVPAENYTPYKTLANLPGMDLVYRSWTNTHPNNSIPHDDWDEMVGGINHLPLKEQDEIRNTLTVPTHLCCTNPYWLYRIYQDTYVDLDELELLVSDALVESRRLLWMLQYRNVEEAAVLPAVVLISQYSCLGGEMREPGTLWVTWELPWNDVNVDTWVIHIESTDSYFSTNETTVAIPGFEPDSNVTFTVRGIVKGREQAFGPSTYCTV